MLLPDETSRRAWPDVAKGVCILLVVLWHVITKHYQRVDWPAGVPFSAVWGTLGEQLLPLRMPLFFTISGLFAASAVERSWPDLVRTRIAKLTWLYVLWLAIHTAVMWWTPSFDTAHARSTGELVEQLTVSPTNLWYLYALAIYVALARLTRRVPAVPLLGAAAVVAVVAAAHLVPVPGNRGQLLQSLVFFLGGLRLRRHVEDVARTSSCRRFVLLGVSYALGLAAMSALGAQRWWGVWTTVSVLATCWGITAAVLVGRHLARTTRVLRGLGARTLPIYVMHLPMLAVLDRQLRGAWSALEPRTAALAAVEPIVLTVALVVTCLVLHRLLTRLRCGWLFALPRLRTRRRAPAPSRGRSRRRATAGRRT